MHLRVFHKGGRLLRRRSDIQDSGEKTTYCCCVNAEELSVEIREAVYRINMKKKPHKSVVVIKRGEILPRVTQRLISVRNCEKKASLQGLFY